MTEKDDAIAKAIERATIAEPEGSDYIANVTDGLFAIAEALDRCADALIKLGMNDACTPFGAMENLSMEVKNGFQRLADSIEPLSDG